MNKESYTAASNFPIKLLHQEVIKDGKIIPVHIQLSPTNACNLNCEFCSCSDRDKSKKLSFDQIAWILDVCSKRGTEAITVTGGGEPLIYPKINEVIEYANYLNKGMEVGLVTNGILLDQLKYHSNLTWCRISNSDDRIPAYDAIEETLMINPKTDFAFSHVVTENPNYNVMADLIDFANKNNFTHVRLVSDLCNLEKIVSMNIVKNKLSKLVDDSKVIYQGRKNSTRGEKNCYISLLKPVIAPEGIFPCCGAQYSIHGQPRDMIDKMKMGEIKDLPEILDTQKHFDGSICDRCYYDEYNQLLSKLKEKPQHLNFV